MEITLIELAVCVLVCISTLLLIRLSVCLPSFRSKRKRVGIAKQSLMIFIGSGGHTTEMLRLISNMDREKFEPIHIVISHSDTTSLARVQHANLPITSNAIYHTLYRSREVKQSWLTTVWTTAISVSGALQLILSTRPQIIICNGPGTCVPICYSAFAFRLLGLMDPVMIFVESFCRVTTISLSGKLLYPIVDKFVVQWPELTTKYKRAEYLGVIC